MSSIQQHIDLVSEHLDKPARVTRSREWRRPVMISLAVLLPLVGVGLIVTALMPDGGDYVDPPVFQAISAGKMDYVKAAIERDPSVLNEHDADGNTLLYAAVVQERLRMVELLLQYGANANTPNAQGDTPLAAAVRCGGHRAQVITSLLTNGAQPESPLPQGGNVLHLAASLPRMDRQTLLLLAKNPDAKRARDRQGLTPLQVAQQHRSYDAVQVLAASN